MKVLIWIVCFFCMAVVQMIVKDSGIILGGIPTALLFGLTWFVAQKLCKKWGNRKKDATADTHNGEPIVDASRSANDNNIENDSLTTEETQEEIVAEQDKTTKVAFKDRIFSLLSNRKMLLLLTIGSAILMLISAILAEEDGSYFFEDCASVFLILVMIFGCIYIVNISVTVIAPLIKKKYTPSLRIKNSNNKFCKYCGAEIDKDSIFCSHCGKNITKGR